MNRPADVPPDVWNALPPELQGVVVDFVESDVPADTAVAATTVLGLATVNTLTITPDDLIPILGWVDEAILWSTGGFLASRAVQGKSLDQAVTELLP